MKVYQIYTNSPLRNYTYVLVSDDQKNVISIDPYSAKQVIDFLETKNLLLTHIVNTHEHHDHVGGNEKLVDRYNARVYAHVGGEKSIPCFDEAIEENRIFKFGADRLKVLETPGHTFAHVSLLLEINGVDYAVFSGDTVFNAGVGNCHNGGDPSVMYETIEEKYKKISDNVILYPGHDYLMNNLRFSLNYEPSNKKAKLLFEKFSQSSNTTKNECIVNTMGLEREINLFFRLENKSIHDSLGMDTTIINKQKVFLRLRQLRNQW